MAYELTPFGVLGIMPDGNWRLFATVREYRDAWRDVTIAMREA